MSIQEKFPLYDFVIIGGGVVGLSTGIALLEQKPGLKVMLVEKESIIASHASGRNSGVVHAGFYYSQDSLKAKYCKSGNIELRKLVKKHEIPIAEIGKIVVPRDQFELSHLETLFERGQQNGIEIEMHEVSMLHKYEPLARAHEKFIWSPTTAVSNPFLIANALRTEYLLRGGKLTLGKQIQLTSEGGELDDKSGEFNSRHFINCAGLQALEIAKIAGIGTEYTLLPVMGRYKKAADSSLKLRRLVYPVPHKTNPFLGVHFTINIDGQVKIGPTALPVLGKENYSLLNKPEFSEIAEFVASTWAINKSSKHNVLEILQSEVPKLKTAKLVKLASQLVPDAINIKKWESLQPGIRAQLIKRESGEFEQDFVVKTGPNSTHILNAVSPGWTSSIPFGRYIAEVSLGI